MGFSSDINLYISSSNVVIILSLCLCLAVFSRGKFARKGRWRRTNIYPRRAILFNLQFESSSGECGRRVQVFVCAFTSIRERERERGKQEEDESRRFHVWRVKTQSPGSVYRGYTSKLIFVSPIPPSGTAPNLGFSSIIPPFVSFIPFLLFISNNIRNSRAT